MMAGGIRMLENVPRRYVRRRSELTEAIEGSMRAGNMAYRTALVCECRNVCNVRVSGAVVVDGCTGAVVEYVVRCRSCAGKEGDYGTL
jgi:hypothetical protein